MSEPYPEPDPSLSRDAAHSTYAPATQEEQNPPLGSAVEQTLGKPAEAPAAKPASRSSSSSSSSSSS